MKTIDMLVQLQQQADTNHDNLVKEVQKGFTAQTAAMSAHTLEDAKQFAILDKRLVPIESLRSTLRWTVGTMFAGLAYAVFDFLVNHAHKVVVAP